MDESPHGRDLVVVGASAGGIEALRQVLGGLPEDLAAAVLVVLHLSPNAPSALARVLQPSTSLPVRSAVDGAPLEPGVVHVGIPGAHLLVTDDHVTVSRGPVENGHRPAVDPLLRTAARARGSRVIACILSGTLDDGAAGAAAVVMAGGVVVVQDPDDAAYGDMPRSVLERVAVTASEPAARLGEVIVGLVTGEPGPTAPGQVHPVPDPVISAERRTVAPDDADWGATYTCPDCQGPMMAQGTDELATSFRCRVGHAWNAESLLAEQGRGVERALWIAVRVLEEQASLARRLETGASDRGNDGAASRFADRAAAALEQAGLLRRVIADDVMERPATA